MPSFDQGKLVVDLDLGAGAGFAQTDEKTMLVERYLRLPEVQDSLATIGSDTAVSTSEIIVRLKDKTHAPQEPDPVARELREWGAGLPAWISP